MGSGFIAPNVKTQRCGPGARTDEKMADAELHQGLDYDVSQLKAGRIASPHAGHQDWAVSAWYMG